ncbi:metallophosphoesterase [Aquisalimonas sp. 2447]|uniref:metallophosphoesterase n=1 Tax=Aquisalimonas sp. 2447 TaxID=2740807 RepID=UPI0014326050|nr:metallophosphoesterase [Aquisalimonas sp. 2447]
MLERALDALGFDPVNDRVLSVGDLIDRGPESADCLALLEAPWFHAVMGNHEDMMLRRLAGDPGAAALHLENGGEWLHGRRHPEEEPRLAANVEAAAKLPHLITVGGGNGECYHVVHAELPTGAATVVTDSELEAGIDMDPAHLLWTRKLMLGGGEGVPERAPGLSTTYCGHTPHPQVRRRRSHVCLDTGAVFACLTGDETAGALTMVERQYGREMALHRFAP